MGRQCSFQSKIRRVSPSDEPFKEEGGKNIDSLIASETDKVEILSLIKASAVACCEIFVCKNRGHMMLIIVGTCSSTVAL
jgi:hypothetical protein